VRRTSNQTDSDVTCTLPDRAIKGKSQTRLKDNQGCEKPVCLKKNIPSVFFKSAFFVFLKRNWILFFLKNTQNPHSELFLLHLAISPFSELHNNNLLYLILHSNLRVNKCLPSLFSQSVVGQLTPNWQRLARTRRANREKPFPHKLCSFMSSLCTCLASSKSI